MCQGWADLSEGTEFDDELDCPGELAADYYAEEINEGKPHTPPPPSPHSSPSPVPSHSSSHFFEPPPTSHVIRPTRYHIRYSPVEVKVPSSREGRSKDHKKLKKRHEAIGLACHFCRKRKITCQQPPRGSLDPTCKWVSLFIIQPHLSTLLVLFWKSDWRPVSILVNARPVEWSANP